MDFATTAVTLALKIKDILEQRDKNEKELVNLMVAIADDCTTLGKMRSAVKDHVAEIDQFIAQFQSSLQDLYENCEKLMRVEPGFRGKLRSHYNTFFNGEDLKEEIKHMYAKIRTFREQFMMKVSFATLSLVSQNAGNATAMPITEAVSHSSTTSVDLLLPESAMTLAVGSGTYQSLSRSEERINSYQPSRDRESRLPFLSEHMKQIRENVSATLLLNGHTTDADRDAEHVVPMDTLHLSVDDAVEEAKRLADITSDTPEFSAFEWLRRVLQLCRSASNFGIKSDAVLLLRFCCSLAEELAEENERYGLYPAEPYYTLSHVLANSLEGDDDLSECISLLTKAAGILRGDMEDEDQAKKLHPILARYLDSLAGLYCKSNDYTSAKQCLDEIIDHKPGRKLSTLAPGMQGVDQAKYLIRRAGILQLMNRRDEASDCIAASLDLLRGKRDAESALAVLEFMCDRLDKWPGMRSRLSEALALLASVAYSLKKRNEAIEAVKKAIALRRYFVDNGQLGHQPPLGRYLSSLASYQHGSGHYKEAAQSAQESADVLEQVLERENSISVRSDLADSYHKLALYLKETKDHDEAIDAASKAVEMRFALQKKLTKKYGAVYLDSLLLLSDIQNSCGDGKAALDAAKDAFAFAEQVGVQDLGSSKDYVIEAHFFLGRQYRRNKEVAKACEHIEHAVCLQREAVENKHRIQDKFGLFKFVEDYGIMLRDDGKHREALEQFEEACSLGREIYQYDPVLHCRRYATALHELSQCLTKVGRHDEALAWMRESVKVVQTHPSHATEEFFAIKQHRLASLLARAERYDEAIEAEEVAVNIAKVKAKERNRYLGDLVPRQICLSTYYSKAKDQQSALEVIEEAVDYASGYARRNPDNMDMQERYAWTLKEYAVRLRQNGRRTDSVVQIRLVVDVYWKIKDRNSKRYTPRLIAACDDLATQLFGMGHAKEALHALQDAIAIKREYDEHDKADLARSLDKLSTQLVAIDTDCDEALEASREAVTLARDLADADGETHGIDLGCYLVTLGQRLEDCEQVDLAMETYREAMDILEGYSTQYPSKMRKPYRVAKEHMEKLQDLVNSNI